MLGVLFNPEDGGDIFLRMDYTALYPRGLNIQLDGLVGIRMGYGQNGRGSIPGTDERVFFSLERPDGFWGPRSVLTNRCG
jgi:hypothetical protein